MVDSINIDAGGTFTDGYVTRGDRRESVKVPTTPHDLTVCFVECIEKAAGAVDVEVADLLADTEVLRLATTLGTNTVLERSGPKLGLVVTSGQEEALYGAGIPEDFLVDPTMVRGVDEEVDADGTVVRRVDPEEALAGVRSLVRDGARLVVVALENAALAPENERAIRDAVRERYPQHYLRSIPVQLSTEVIDVPDDRRRTMAAIVNAYIHRQMSRNLYKAEDRVRDRGYDNPLLAVHSDGGATRVAKTRAINTYSSGPAAGLIGTAKLAGAYGFDAVVGADMGGTSVDAAVVEDGTYAYDLTPTVAGVEVAVPMLRMHSIGAGGGSIASVENGDGDGDGGEPTLTVGPESAGARPGPACYDLGGTRPTVTDADVVLGYINPEYFLGGDRDLSAQAAREAVETHVADPLGVDVGEAALRVKQAVDRNVGADLAALADRRGVTPDALFAFGGAGPLHAPDFAAHAGVDTILTFPFGSVFNAYGQSTMDVLHDYTRTIGVSVADAEVDHVARAVAEMEEEALLDMRGEGFDADEVTFEIEALLNHPDGERRLVTVPESLAAGDVERLASRYAQAGGLDGSTGSAAGAAAGDVDQAAVAFEAVRLTARVAVPDPETPTVEEGDADPSAARKGERVARWPDGEAETPVYAADRLAPGNVVEGPALVEATDTTYLVPGPWTFRVDAHRNGVLER